MTEIRTSKGEQKLINLFRRGGIKFEREIAFDDLTGKCKVPLRFDFGLYKNGRLICLVEFDGRQHFEYVQHFHKTLSGFKRQQEWDRRKNKYCLMHRIPLIRVPYWDLEDLTLKKVLTNPEYLVKDKFHIDNLKRQGVRK